MRSTQTITPARALTWRRTASGHALYLRNQGKAAATGSRLGNKK